MCVFVWLFLIVQNLPDNAILVADGGDFVGAAAYMVRPRGPLQWLDPGAFGTLGVGGGFALGAKVIVRLPLLSKSHLNAPVTDYRLSFAICVCVFFQVVHPDRPVFILWGDGSCGYSIMEYDTFTRLPFLRQISNCAWVSVGVSFFLTLTLCFLVQIQVACDWSCWEWCVLVADCAWTDSSLWKQHLHAACGTLLKL